MAVVANVAINVDAKQALAQLNAVDRASKGLDQGLQGAAVGAKGLGAALQSALGPLLAVSTAIAAVQKGLDTAFTRGAAEQRLRNLTDSTGEYQAALATAASTADKFGMSQTETTKALADVFGRLKGVGFGLQETAQIYEGFNVVAKQSGLSAADAAGTFFQLSQALGKGKLNGDEFVTVSERMPQLLDAIAAATGKSRGELSRMAQDGQITSEVLYKALATSAEAAGNLNGKLTEQQRAFNQLGQVGDRLSNILGQAFAPFVIKGAELLAIAGQKISEWYEYLGAVVFPKVLSAVQPVITELQKIWSQIPWQTILGYLQGALIQAFNNIVLVLRVIAPIIAKILQYWQQLAANPVFKFIAQQVERVAGLLGISGGEVQKFTEEQKKATAETAKTAANYSSMPEKIKQSIEPTKAVVDAARQQVEIAKSVTAEINNQVKSLDLAGRAINGRFEVEKQLNDLQIQQLERQYSFAKTEGERLKIATQILREQLQGAQIEYNQAIARLQIEQQKLQLQIEAAAAKQNEIIAEGQLQKLKAQSVEDEAKRLQKMQEIDAATGDALAAQQQVVQGLIEQQPIQEQILRQEEQNARLKFEANKLTARGAFEQKAVSKEIGLSQDQAVRLSGAISQGVTVTGQLQSGMAGVAREAANAANQIQNAINLRNMLSGGGNQNAGAQQAADGAYWSGGFKAFADGGVVSKPTLGLVGEGGEPEYIIPASKMDEAMSRYAQGQRGSSVIPSSINPQVNVTTGPVMNMNGSNYVSQQDFLAGMQTASRRGAEMALQALQGSNSVRRAVGVG